ncbi:hypothetical protein GBP62_25165 [Mycobacterium avium subsp. hominissuis]|uniref:phage virion morphogenesis protein n=1 Tax=Mycobacterium avium TaxID=1764 RepID=UPI001CC755ED|nr:phage virion morphogenesis protein [Mycobacterium avium]MBZ4533131.1 hypothetical protein [Mycobacterium avium subsp. hominissuis]
MASSLELDLEVQNAEKIEKMLADLGLDIKDMRSAMDDVGKSTIKYFSGQVFASRGSTIGDRWPRLSDKYATWKAKRWAGKPVLVRTGTMQSSFTKKASNMEVVIGNSAPYFKYHQSSEPRKKIPRRAMIGIYTGMQDDVTKTIAAALSKKIRERTGR